MKNQKPLYGRYLNRIDQPTRQQTKKTMDHYFQQGPIYLPNHYKIELCQGCGFRNLNEVKTETYMGQKFCKSCVDDWTSHYIDPKTGKRIR